MSNSYLNTVECITDWNFFHSWKIVTVVHWTLIKSPLLGESCSRRADILALRLFSQLHKQFRVVVPEWLGPNCLCSFSNCVQMLGPLFIFGNHSHSWPFWNETKSTDSWCLKIHSKHPARPHVRIWSTRFQDNMGKRLKTYIWGR